MISKIANLLKDEISSVTWVETIGGLAKATKTAGLNNTEIIIPTCKNVSSACDNSDLKSLVPTSVKKSVLFFEAEPAIAEKNMINHVEWSVNIKLLVWVNYKLIDQDMVEPSRLILDILHNMPTTLPNVPNYLNGMVLEYVGQNENKEDMFNKYTFFEKETQYVTYPYDCFSLTFNVSFRTPKTCLDNTTLNPTAC